MEWRIVKTSTGYHAEKGVRNHSSFIRSDFIVYESARFDTESEARRYIKRHSQ